jgi:hypothetical protein
MASAYAYADGGLPSKEMQLLGYLDRYGGAINVLGRPLGAGEMRRMTIAENICKWYRERENGENIVEWTNSNPQKADTLHAAYEMAKEMRLIDG